MERVVTINLNGNSYQLEEPAFDALRAYLSRAEAALAENPDKAEIVRDLEQAIADKCGVYLSSAKTVVSMAEMAQILQEMGPVEGEGSEAPRAENTTSEPPRRRLYRTKDRAMISGVCSGIGAYFDLDPNVIRLLFILAAIFTSGFGLLVYMVLMFALPSANTSEEWAAAHGVPFNAQEIIDRAKREYGNFTGDAEKNWRREHRAWRRHWNRHQRSWDDVFIAEPQPAAAYKPASYATRMFAGLFALIFSLVSAALLIAFLVALYALLGAGAMFDWALPADVPIWLAVLVLALIYGAISTPIGMLRRSSYATLSGQPSYHGGYDTLVTLALIGIAGWIAYTTWPEARDVLQSLPDALRAFGTSLKLEF